jgi:hypothetical protein
VLDVQIFATPASEFIIFRHHFTELNIGLAHSLSLPGFARRMWQSTWAMVVWLALAVANLSRAPILNMMTNLQTGKKSSEMVFQNSKDRTIM